MATKYEYFRLAHQSKMTIKRWWVLRAFSLPTPTIESGPNGRTAENLKKPGYFFFDDQNSPWMVNREGELEEISDFEANAPLFGIKEPVNINKDDFLIVKQKIESFYSNLYLNLVLFEYPFGDQYPYHNGRFSGKMLDAMTAKGLKDRTMDVGKYRTFTKACGFLAVLASIAVPSASPKSFIPPSDIEAVRTKLLEENKGKLDDPVTIARIEKALADHYREYFKDDPAALEFYIKEKSFAITLKRTHMMFGAEPKLEDPSKMDIVIPSLREGWDINYFPQMVNSARMGSYNRGVSTALGGEAAKFSSRVFQNTGLSESDCGTTVPFPVWITKYNYDLMRGQFLVDGQKLIEIQKGDLKSKIGQVLHVRSPMTCHTLNGNFCETCMGKAVAGSGVSLGSQASSVGSIFLDTFMSLTHGRKLETHAYDPGSCIE